MIRKEGADVFPANKTTIGFTNKPSEAEVRAEFERRHRSYDFIKIDRLWDASLKAESLMDHYGHSD